jgi:hypothetical protein
MIGGAVGGGIGVAILGILGYFFAYPAFLNWWTNYQRSPFVPNENDNDIDDEENNDLSFGYVFPSQRDPRIHFAAAMRPRSGECKLEPMSL